MFQLFDYNHGHEAFLNKLFGEIIFNKTSKETYVNGFIFDLCLFFYREVESLKKLNYVDFFVHLFHDIRIIPFNNGQYHSKTLQDNIIQFDVASSMCTSVSRLVKPKSDL